MSRAIIFPGQGSQIVGMGKEFFDRFPAARYTFQEVDDSLNYNLSKTIFEGPVEELTLTTNAQPALMAVSIAILSVIINQSNKKINHLCEFVAGHSLGEYTALCAANSLSLSSTAKLLHLRGNAMQSACEEGKGAMAACIGIKYEDLLKILDNLGKEGACQIANDNVEGQIVVSGHVDCISQIIAVAKDTGFKAIKLKVSAPFHSNLIVAAKQPMQQALDNIDMKAPVIPLIANVTADIVTDPNQIKQNLIDQICGTVRWRETLHKFSELGVEELVEVGSGTVLTGLAKKSPLNFSTRNISNSAELEDFLKNL